MAESFSEKEIVNYPNGGKSTFYTSGQTAVIIDEGICRRDSEENIFPYTLITDKQNEYSKRQIASTLTFLGGCLAATNI